MGKWEYVGRSDGVTRGEERRHGRTEVSASRWRGYDPQQNRSERRPEGQYRTNYERRHSERETEWNVRRNEKYQRKNRMEAIVLHKMEQTETYANILKKVKNSINIEKLGIQDTRIRRTATGSLLIQIAGEECNKKADALAEQMRKVVGEGARIGRPCRKAEIRISGLDEDTTVEEVAAAISKYGECDSAEIKAGAIRRNRLGEGDIWVRCPWPCARELNKERRIRIGWVGARVNLMKPAPTQCFRCWEYGHVKAQCRNATDRTNKCYRCGTEGHKATECGEMPKCMLCKEKGKSYNHRMGNKECSAKNGYRNRK